MTAMRFGAFHWPLNPTELRVEDGRHTRESTFPSPMLQDAGPVLRTVSGRGFFAGETAAAQFAGLHALLSGSAQVLTVPEYGPMYAVLTQLDLLRGSIRLVEYAFTFQESPVEISSQPCRPPALLLQEGETLWHLAARLSISIERLLALNPQIPEPWSVTARMEVKVR